jgi:hypothetical protein
MASWSPAAEIHGLGRVRSDPIMLQEGAMDLFEYGLRAYNLLLDLVLLILSPFVGPLRYVAIGGVVLVVLFVWLFLVTLHKRRGRKP